MNKRVESWSSANPRDYDALQMSQNLHPFTLVSLRRGDSMLPLAASTRLCLLPLCTLMRVVIQCRFPLADVLSSPGHSSEPP